MIVTVGRKQILEAKKTLKHNMDVSRCRVCPVAVALRDAGYAHPHVGPYRATVGEFGTSAVAFADSTRTSVVLSRSAQRFIARFDSDLPVKPFRFKFNL